MKILIIGGDANMKAAGIFLEPITYQQAEKVRIDLFDEYNGQPTKADYIMDAHEMSFKDKEFDVVMASDVFEHSPNPLGLLKEILRVAKKYVYLSIPLIDGSYDKYRPLTTTEHIATDYKNQTDCLDTYHIGEYEENVVMNKSTETCFTWIKDFHARWPISYPYVHQHTFTMESIRELMEWATNYLDRFRIFQIEADNNNIFVILEAS